mgnify:CR=1 FL=1
MTQDLTKLSVRYLFQALVQPQPIRVVMLAYTIEAFVTELGTVPPSESVQELP